MLTRLLIALLCAALLAPAAALAGKSTTSSKRPKPGATTPTEPTPAPAAPLFGFNDFASLTTNQIDAATGATLAKGAGAGARRIVFDWRLAQPTQADWRVLKYDRVYNADLAVGIKPVFTLLFSPTWTWDASVDCSSTDCRYPPANTEAGLSAWREMVKRVVTRWPQMAALEVWNEPNMRGFWESGADPARYAALLRATRAAVAEAGSSVPVLGGAVTYVADEPGSIQPRQFLTGMYEAGAKGHLDGLSFHPYLGSQQLHKSFKLMSEVREVRDTFGDTSPLWVSEVGVHALDASDPVAGETRQATVLPRVVGAYRKIGDVRGTFVHTLVTPPWEGTEGAYGVVRLDLSLRPAYCALASLNGVAGCPVAVPQADPAQAARWDAQEFVQLASDAMRVYYKRNGSLAGLDAADINAIDPRISATPATGDLAPGPTAVPNRVGVYVWGTAPALSVDVCATSRADRSYCVLHTPGKQWTYGSAAGSIFAAAGATNNGASNSW